VGRVADATTPAPRRSDDAIAFATAMELQQRRWGRATATLQRVSLCQKWLWAQGGCAVDPASLLLGVAMLRLVVVPCLNAHKRHVRDPPPLPITLLEYYTRR
jgi:hypothetical protein